MRNLDKTYMLRALELAGRGAGWTSPNPMVGAIVVKNGEIIGEGWHQRYGEAHAEIHAMAGLSREALRGADLYVSLEPCSHYGKTPPCAQALIEAGIKRVVVAMEDPNPLVAGRGITMLRDAGIEVETGVMADEAAKLNEIFLHYIVNRRPFVAIKTAMTLDGRICTATGASKWITGPQSRARVHELRHRYSAILVGIGTILADNPSLTTRLEHEDKAKASGRNPLRVILDSKLRIPMNAKVLECQKGDNMAGQTLVFTTAKAPTDKIHSLLSRGVGVHVCQRGRVEVDEVLRVLAERGVDSLLVEGGSEINATFLEAGAVSKIYAFIAPKLIGGRDAKGPVGGEGLASLEDAWEVEKVTYRAYGSDLLVEGYIKLKGSETLCSQD